MTAWGWMRRALAGAGIGLLLVGPVAWWVWGLGGFASWVAIAMLVIVVGLSVVYAVAVLPPTTPPAAPEPPRAVSSGKKASVERDLFGLWVNIIFLALVMIVGVVVALTTAG